MKVEQIEGLNDLKKIFEDTLNSEDKQLRTILARKPLVYLLGKEFSEEYMKNRIEKGIHLKSLRASSKKIDSPDHEDHSKLLKEARIVPKDIRVTDSFIIWNDKVAIIDDESLTGTIVEGENNSKSIKRWFDSIWERGRIK